MTKLISNEMFALCDDSYLSLSAAILLQAEEDYCKALFFNDEKEIKALEKFYNSGWCNVLSFNNSQEIIGRIKPMMSIMKKHCKVVVENAKGKGYKKYKYITDIKCNDKYSDLIGRWYKSKKHYQQNGCYVFKRFGLALKAIKTFIRNGGLK